ncbi:hypothetical protein ACLMAL_03340 [Nocardia sp. CWNU-33]|uniref:hypothetical protein n=1 Tax=Nocardia sp. CWNU-33 TaxID=3392117 RepID=UPI00398E3A42
MNAVEKGWIPCDGLLSLVWGVLSGRTTADDLVKYTLACAIRERAELRTASRQPRKLTLFNVTAA